MNLFTTLVFIGLMQPGCIGGARLNQAVNPCKCTESKDPIITFKVKAQGQLIFCGRLDKELSKNKFVISEFKLIDCNGGAEIIDQSEDAVSKSIVTVNTDNLLIAETHYVLNSNWEIDIVPATEITIKFIKGKPKLSSKRNVFVATPLSKQLQDSLIALNKNLKEKAKVGKVIYPYDEKSIYLLFMGAVNGNADAKYLLKNLEKLFILDGSIAETRGEIWWDF